MELALTWNLVILSAFVMLCAYSFLLGQDGTIKLILSTYMAILAADGLAGVLQRFVFEASPGFMSLAGDDPEQIFSGLRIGLLVTAVVCFTVKSSFHIHLETHAQWSIRFLMHLVFSGLSTLLLLSTVLIYMSGNSFVEGMMLVKDISIYQESLLAQILIDYYQAWFSLPAVAFLGVSFFLEAEK